MITLLADLVLRRVCTPRTTVDVHHEFDNQLPAPPIEILTGEQAAPNTVPHHEWLPPPAPSPVLAEPFKESLVALLTELAWRRARAIERQQENSNDQSEDLQYTPGTQGLRLRATVNIHAGNSASREHRAAI